MANSYSFLTFLNGSHGGYVASFICGYAVAQNPDVASLVEALGYRLHDFPSNPCEIDAGQFLLGALSSDKKLSDALRACYSLPENGATVSTEEVKAEEVKTPAPAQADQLGEAVYPAGQEPTVKPAETTSTGPDAPEAPAPEEETGDDIHPANEEDEYLEEDPEGPTDWEEEPNDQIDRGEEEEKEFNPNVHSAYLRRGCTCRPMVHVSADYIKFGDKKNGSDISGLRIHLPLDSEVVVELGHCPLRITADDTTPDHHEACESNAESAYPASLECDGYPVTDDPAGTDGDDESPFEGGGPTVTH